MLRRLGLMFASLLVSLAMAELAATAVARGAYPYLNLFEKDTALGVSLERAAKTRIKSRTGRVTSIETNAAGRRVHPVGDGDRILLLGDSQVFGYHVEAASALASQLAKRTGAEVIDAAVPSYGPSEYVAIAERLVPELRPRKVVFVANLANDWWESNVPNQRRSTARDGWLVSLSSRQAEAVDFPGRRFLFGRSHFVLAVRRVAAHAGSKPMASTPVRLLRDLESLRAKRQRFTPYLSAVKRIAEANGAEVVAVGLPIDVLVDDREWDKYRGARRDVAPLATLLEDFLDEATALEIEAIDLLPHLRAASPGAFLDDDPHLSPKGHAVVAEVLSS